jgi:hypothetical protein
MSAENGTINYLPIPPRVWSRVQPYCIYQKTEPTSQTILNENLYKGNILQYKNNSAQLTKKQKYAQIAKGCGPSRKKVYATQSQTYTNPNTNGLLRVNYATIPFPNEIVGEPNNISGPYQYDVPNPFGCPTTSLQDGGNLVCGVYENPCTGEIVKRTSSDDPFTCFPNTCSDVPGAPTLLCWSNNLPTFFPRQRYFMNNSSNKWPQGYKGLVSSATPIPPILSLNWYTYYDPGDPASIAVIPTPLLSWTFTNNTCLPISGFNIYMDGVIIANVNYTVTTYNVYAGHTFYITSLSTTVESSPSNSIST